MGSHQTPESVLREINRRNYVTTRRVMTACVLIMIGLLSSQCGSESDEGPERSPTIPSGTTVDTIPPAAISDLVAKIPTISTVYLVWTAPGDDDDEGIADSYDIRYDDEVITEQNWEDATQFDGEPRPRPAKQWETLRVGGLNPFTEYFFAIKTTDDEGNVSELSNCDSVTTLQESTCPVKVTDLEAIAIGDRQALLTWTAPGDDGNVGTAAQYEIRYAQKPISSSNWYSAFKVSQPPTPKPSGEPESLIVSVISDLRSHYFALKAADEVPNWSDISNVAFAMGYSIPLEVSSQTIQVGEQMIVRFRAPGGVLVAVYLNRYGIWDCDPSHVWIYDTLVSGRRLEEGIYEVTCDFKTEQGDYLPRTTYYVVLCWQFEIESTVSVEFEGEP